MEEEESHDSEGEELYTAKDALVDAGNEEADGASTLYQQAKEKKRAAAKADIETRFSKAQLKDIYDRFESVFFFVQFFFDFLFFFNFIFLIYF